MREPIEIVEIDLDYCSKTYGVTCSATMGARGLEKCYNTINTCQVPDEFDLEIKVIKFCKDGVKLANDCLPLLTKATATPPQLNIGGADSNKDLLGKRAVLKASFKDGTFGDLHLDKYYKERLTGEAVINKKGYDPATKSTFWRKWIARNPYMFNRNCRLITGYLKDDGTVAEQTVRHYVITSYNNIDNKGNYALEAKDVLSLLDSKKTECPRTSTNFIKQDFPANATSIKLEANPVDLVVNGYASIGDEMIKITSISGATVGIQRAQYGTTANDIKERDTLQTAKVITAKGVTDILYDLLVNYAGLSPNMIDTAQWNHEAIIEGYLPYAFSAVIANPTSVQQLISELLEQAFCYIWWDEISGKVKLKAIRKRTYEDAIELTDEANILADSVKVKERYEQVISRCVIRYAQINPLADVEDKSNYRVSDIVVDLEAEGRIRNNSVSTKEIYARWLQNASGAIAKETGERLIARYKQAPKEISFALDAKDRNIKLADFVVIDTKQIVGANGNRGLLEAQVISAQETQTGHRIEYVANSFEFEEQPEPDNLIIVISADMNSIDLRSVYDSQILIEPEANKTITFVIRSGVVVSSNSTSTPALRLRDNFNGAKILLIIEAGAYVVGRGGAGGRGGLAEEASKTAGGNGGNGGNAMQIEYEITIENNGTIGGGGGGGGGGGAVGQRYRPSYRRRGTVGGGGGGGGASYGTAGAKGTNGRNRGSGRNPAGGGAGSVSAGGAGGANGTRSSSQFRIIGGVGGKGGDLGQNGEAGKLGTIIENDFNGSKVLVGAGAGGLAGKAIVGVSYVQLDKIGTIKGEQIG